MISLAAPWLLLMLPLPLLVWWLAPPHRERVPALRFPLFRSIVTAADAQARPGAVVPLRTRMQMLVAAAIWVLLVLALAGPERMGAPVEITRAARDVVLAIDISGSMDTRDFTSAAASGGDGDAAPRQQRFAAVREVVRRFVEGREGDRVALIVFGTKAYVQAPLTEDLGTIVDLLDRTEVGMAGPHTALGDAIGLAIRTFEASEVDQRLLILLSDGSDTASRMSPVNAAEIAAGEGVEIFTIGVGDPEASGEDRVDLATLQDIAARTGGAYFFAADESALEAVYERIDELAPREVERLSYRPRRSLAHIPLALAALIGLLALAFLHFGARRRGAAAWRGAGEGPAATAGAATAEAATAAEPGVPASPEPAPDGRAAA